MIRPVIKCCLLATASILAAPALAQSTSHKPDSTTQQQDEEQAGQGEVAEILVTAQRREQNLQDVPISLTAVAGDTLARRGLSDFGELQKVAPGLNFVGANNPRGSGIAIRGVGTISFSEGIEGSVGIVLDGVPIGRQSGGFTDLADLERIEVLRGPQGTLFGKNASAGVISIVTKRPTRELQFDGLAAYGEHNDTKLRANVSGPLVEGGRLRGSLSSYYTHADGFVENLYRDELLNGRDEWGVRAKIAYDVTDDVEFMVTGDYSRRNADCCIWTVRSFAPGTSTRAQQTLNQYGIVPGPNNRQVALDGDVYQRQTTRGVAGELNWSLPGDLTLTSITAVRGWTSIDNNDADQTPTNGLNLNYGGIWQHQFTQEVRLATPSGRQLEFVLGAFYFDQRTRSDLRQAGTLFNATVPAGSRFGSKTIAIVDTENAALFGDLTWRITDSLRAFGGVRVTRETISFDQTIETSPGDLPYPGRPNGAFNGSQSDTALSWRAGLQVDITPDVMIYSSIARGYKGGGFNILIGNLTTPQPIAPEIPTNYEVGLKSSFFDRRIVLNTSIFRTDFRDFQAQTLAVNPANGNFIFDLRNAGRLRSQGVEADITAIPFDGLTLNAGISYLDAKFSQFFNAPCYNGQRTFGTGCVQAAPGVFAQDLSGARLPNAPKWNIILGGRYEGSVTSTLNGFIDVSWSYRSTVNTQQAGDPNQVQPGFGLFDASFGVKSDAGWTLSVYAKNLFNQSYAERIIDTPLAAGSLTTLGSYSSYLAFGGRRTVGVQFAFKY